MAESPQPAASDFRSSLQRLAEDLRRYANNARDNPHALLVDAPFIAVAAERATGLAAQFNQVERDLPPQDVDRILQEIRDRKSQRVTFSHMGGSIIAHVPDGADIPLQEAQVLALLELRDFVEETSSQLGRLAHAMEQSVSNGRI